MEPAVVTGAMTMCSFGVAPCTLTVTSQMQCLADNKPIATIQDFTPANLPTFGMCTNIANPAVAAATAAAMGVLTPAPCARMPAGPWLPKQPAKLIGGKPVLCQSSMCMCGYGGQITITNPGQMKVLV